ncbi:hypothetical protein PInf_001731 [Phytophthora infestans]|nr:hypothetical protein PInf_001731 [Phytophthora infestans]
MAGGSVFQVGEDVELYQVVIVLSALAIFLVIFEAALHHLEHHLLAHNDKYQHMLQKVYRELMILGLISFVIKILTKVGGIDGYSSIMLALQVSDLIIFILAITLVLQAINVLLLLRGYNKRADRAELITTQDLVDALDKPSTNSLFKKEVVTHRLLRHLFLRRFGLPQLFPFSKYLRRAQANNIVHMIEVEPSMWLLLLGMAWAFAAVVQILEDYDVDVRYELIETLLAFAWVLVFFHILVMFYFRFCGHRLLSIAGFSKDNGVLTESLRTVADDEANAWHDEAAERALDMMSRIHAQHEEIEHERKAHRRGLLKGDAGFQLLSSGTKRSAPRQTGVVPGTPEIRLPFYSRKAWHVVVMFLTILNGFFVALLVMGAVLISSILRIDASTLGEVVGHFSEIVELRSEFATSLLQGLKSNDLHRTGYIDVDKLRTVLASFGFQLTRFRLNSVVKLLFELRGTGVEYAQLVQLVTLLQQEYCIEDGCFPSFQRTMTSFDDMDRQEGDARSNRRHLPLLAQSSLAPEPGPSDYVSASTPLGRLQGLPGVPTFAEDRIERQPSLQRGLSRQFSGSSSRMLHGVYNLQSSADSMAR